ncbi:MAG TPA: hypothetical protein VGA65_05560 [Hyphomicrobium sp.]
MANAQRALWTFLIYALVAPFFGALAVAAVLVLASAFGLADLLPDDVAPTGAAAIATFVWAIVPAVLTALALAAMVWNKGSFSWIVAAAVAVIAFSVAAVLVPIGLEDARPYLAFLAGVVAIAVRAVLVRMGTIAD